MFQAVPRHETVRISAGRATAIAEPFGLPLRANSRTATPAPGPASLYLGLRRHRAAPDKGRRVRTTMRFILDLERAQPGIHSFAHSAYARRPLRAGALLANAGEQRFADKPVETAHDKLLAALWALPARTPPSRRIWPEDAAPDEPRAHYRAVLALVDEVRNVADPFAAAQALALLHR